MPAIPTSVLGITEESNWNAARIGINGVWRITDRFTLTADAAWIPYARLNAKDFHWLRIGTSFNGPTPEDGNGFSAQLEAILSYNVTREFSVGIGGRYWRFEPKSNGAAHFEVSGIGGGFPQPIKVKTERNAASSKPAISLALPSWPPNIDRSAPPSGDGSELGLLWC